MTDSQETDDFGSRDAADFYKRRLKDQAKKWLVADAEPAAIVAALGETAADLGFMLVGPDYTMELFHELREAVQQQKRKMA